MQSPGDKPEFMFSQELITCRHASGFHEGYTFQPFPFELLLDVFSVCQLPADTEFDEELRGREGIMSLTRTDSEVSLICRAGYEPEGARMETGWRALRISGKLDFSQIGVIARIATLFAVEKISVFVISTFDTDYFFVKEKKINAAIRTLREAQYEVLA